jgi:hypothetical protein
LDTFASQWGGLLGLHHYDEAAAAKSTRQLKKLLVTRVDGLQRSTYIPHELYND